MDNYRLPKEFAETMDRYCREQEKTASTVKIRTVLADQDFLREVAKKMALDMASSGFKSLIQGWLSEWRNARKGRRFGQGNPVKSLKKAIIEIKDNDDFSVEDRDAAILLVAEALEVLGGSAEEE